MRQVALSATWHRGVIIKKRLMAVLGAACALTILSTGTASAGTNSGFVYTTDWDPGGRGAFGHTTGTADRL